MLDTEQYDDRVGMQDQASKVLREPGSGLNRAREISRLGLYRET